MSSSEKDSAVVTQEPAQNRLDVLLTRIHELTATGDGAADDVAEAIAVVSEATRPEVPQDAAQTSVASEAFADQRDSHGDWFPSEPESLRAAGLTESEVEDLLLKILNARSEASGRDLADQVKLPFRLVDPTLQQMKQDQMVAHRGASVMNDYIYQLTNKGRERAKKLSEHCTYFGSAPVSLRHYIDSVAKQTMADQHPSEEDLHRAFDDLLIDKRMLLRLGPAINSGRGLFLYGAPGNGKTSIAERVTKAFGEYVWIPRSIGIDGEILRLYDPSMHEPAPEEDFEGLLDVRKVDNRWVRIRRPTIVVGGELTMSSLEVTLNTATNVSEAPVQLKSNCGTLVIDDFGRQRMTTDELLNRWIVPLEKRYDFLNLASGKKIQVPFDQLIIFSTNLEPKDLVDDAFLRRIPYKIEVGDPEEPAFRELFQIMAPIIGVKYSQESLEYLIKTHYKSIGRPMRCCQPRDLLLQIKNFCHYVKQPAVMTNENLDFAVENYFAVM
ncbi:AAA family ATPase [Aeoliella sp. ICT_H6.2]|uniref:AAA family ATPase n=1 Tax=Aeoliella straminimaris TaxID=2954799 RepID=A0A9X2FAE1_9BACT|nr:AAA family ATPase [Aeoliella straminimaris]MCO6044558.1 AAA family ATPase [Aeoliella straminimaris]